MVMSSGEGCGSYVAVDLSSDVALEAADDFLLGFGFGGAPLDIAAGALVLGHPGDDDGP
jgi:hypothetical protein